MKLQLNNPDIQEWNLLLEKQHLKSVFADEVFLSALAKQSSSTVKRFVVFKKDLPLLILSAFVKYKKIIQPHHFYFNFFWVKPDASAESISEALSFLLHELRKQYHKISLRLPVDFHDIRAFQYHGFQDTLKYTYIKDLSALSYNKNIERILAKNNPQNLFFEDLLLNQLWPQHQHDLQKFGFGQKQIQHYKTWFFSLESIGSLKTFAIKHQEQLICSIISLADHPQKKAYFMLISTADGFYEEGAPAYLYNFAFKQLQKAGFLFADLYGANIPSIAKFKSSFHPQLHSFHELSFSASKVNLARRLSAVKQIVKRTIRNLK